MAPEQAEGNVDDVTTAADVYGLGAVIYELLTRRPPFLGETALATLSRVVKEPPRSPRQRNPLIDADLETVVLKCLEKTPTARYASASLVSYELDRCANGSAVEVLPVSYLERIVR